MPPRLWTVNVKFRPATLGDSVLRVDGKGVHGPEPTLYRALDLRRPRHKEPDVLPPPSVGGFGTRTLRGNPSRPLDFVVVGERNGRFVINSERNQKSGDTPPLLKGRGVCLGKGNGSVLF